MPFTIRDLHTVDDSGKYIVETNVDVPLRTPDRSIPNDPLLVRANVYRPKQGGKYPVLVTYGPYGKDIHYQDFQAKSFSEVNPKHKSAHSAWETPDPAHWTSHGYAVVRVDERGSGQSPGKLDTMSRGTSDAFFDVIEWSAVQPWSSGKVGLLGISYYAGSQWRVAARQPKGLAAIVPWEGMSDYYRDRVRHGGILSNAFIKWWWDRQVGSNQYGLPGRAEKKWGPGSLEGDLSPEELLSNRADQPLDTAKHKYRDEDYYLSRDYDLADIQVPLLSVANWGGILLHLRGNVLGYLRAGSRFKYLRCITGRHDLPFYYDEEVAVQLSFLNAFLKGEDDRGWSTPGKVPPVDLCLRVGDPGFNDAEAERKTFPRRTEMEWPIARTQYTDYHLTANKELSPRKSIDEVLLRYQAPKGEISFATSPFTHETEITGHPLVRLTISLGTRDGSSPTDLDVFVTLRHIGTDGKEIYYTGTAGDPVPIVKGWLRLSLRSTSSTIPSVPPKSPSSLDQIIPHREYLSTDVQPVPLDTPIVADIELWPTNAVMAEGARLVLEVASCDTQGTGLFGHTHEDDRAEEKLKGWNCICIAERHENWLRLPIVNPRG